MMTSILKSEDGFSLLELLVAVAILSIALIPMVGYQATAMQNAARLQDKTLALMVAENVAVRLTEEEVLPAIGRMDGTEISGGIAYHWQAQISALSNSAIRLIRISVLRQGADISGALATLTTSRAEHR